MADITDFQIEMITPEKWRQNERLARAENVARRSLTLALRYEPVFHPNAPARGSGQFAMSPAANTDAAG